MCPPCATKHHEVLETLAQIMETVVAQELRRVRFWINSQVTLTTWIQKRCVLQNLKFTQINSGRVRLARSSLLFDAACRPKMQTFQSNSQWLQRNATIQCALSLFCKNQVSGCLKCGCKEPKLRTMPPPKSDSDRPRGAAASPTGKLDCDETFDTFDTFDTCCLVQSEAKALKQIKLKVTIKKRSKKPNDE